MIKLIDILKEISWNPNDKYENTILYDRKDLENESIVKQFVEFNGLPKIIFDIWKYAKSELKVFPSKISTKGMMFSGKNNTKVEIEINKGQLYLWHIKIEIDGNKIENHLLKNTKFSYLEFKKMMS
jgi:hypothetical protein